MACSRRVLSDLNGDWGARVLFVAEAPGRLGAEKTGIPLFGDRTGDRFEILLAEMGLERHRVFITNAILCNPRDHKGNNASPSVHEIRNCEQFLRRTVEVVNPAVIVTLGRVALDALRSIEPHSANLKDHVGRMMCWGDRQLVVLYHPGPRTVVHRSWADQLHDASSAGRLIRRAIYDTSAAAID